MSEADISAYAVELKKDFNLEERLLRRLIRMQVKRYNPNVVYDLDYDIQLNAALDVLKNTKNFKELVASAKTLKELQQESEAAEKAVDKSADGTTGSALGNGQ